MSTAKVLKALCTNFERVDETPLILSWHLQASALFLLQNMQMYADNPSSFETETCRRAEIRSGRCRCKPRLLKSVTAKFA